MGEQTFTITALAEAFGITSRTIRFYEDKGLLQPVRQGLSRIYSRRDRARLALILRGKRLGFRLAEIHEMIDLYDLGDGQVEQLRVTLQRAEARMAALEQQRRDIDEALCELRESSVIIRDYLQLKTRGSAPPFGEYMHDRKAGTGGAASNEFQYEPARAAGQR